MEFRVCDKHRIFYVYQYRDSMAGLEFAKFIRTLEETASKLDYKDFYVYRDSSGKLCIKYGHQPVLTINSGRYVVLMDGMILDAGPLQIEGMTILSERIK